MDSFFADLKKVRESKRISLADISSATLIDVSMLEAIERGNTSILPQAYVRAFIREYASVVGLDPHETMRKYDEARNEANTTPQQPPVLEPTPPLKKPKPPEPDKRPGIEPRELLTQRNLKIGTGVIVTILVGIGLWALTSGKSSQPVQEIPFEAMVRENEERILGDTTARPAALVTSTRSATKDSLSLHAVISDTVWVQIVVDSAPPLEYLFRPPSRMSWKAKEKFTVTLGNAGAIQFTLNNKQIGTLGKPGNVVRNVEITREELARD
ncbi:MAG: DUF4115 domain-containing protein [Ignavibacteriae bacterium]|nr:DUF4115 domain-containing protein [Ignavibacteriota bacterium]